jgi:hypothetical protein
VPPQSSVEQLARHSLRPPYRVSATAGHAGKSADRFRITHPFHPLAGNEYEMVSRQHNWGENRVFYYGPDGRLKSFPTNVTDLFPIDAFNRISGGRSVFRADDLLALRELLDRHGRPTEGDEDV